MIFVIKQALYFITLEALAEQFEKVFRKDVLNIMPLFCYNNIINKGKECLCMSRVTVGEKVKILEDYLDIRKGSVATIIYIDDFDQVTVSWHSGGQSSFPEEYLYKMFAVA